MRKRMWIWFLLAATCVLLWGSYLSMNQANLSINQARLTEYLTNWIEENWTEPNRRAYRANWKLADSVSMPLPALFINSFTGEKKQLLIRQLSSSAEWHVMRWEDDKLVAIHRQKIDQNFQPISRIGGFIRNFPNFNPKEARILLQLDPIKPTNMTPWYKGWYRVGTDGDRAVQVQPYYPYSKDKDIKSYQENLEDFGLESYVVLKSRNQELGLEVFEESLDPKRTFTRSTIEQVSNTLKRLAQSKIAPVRGFDPGLLPSGSMLNSQEPRLEISGDFGLYRAAGYVNPGEKGYIYLVAYEFSSGELASAREPKKGEYVGWSDNPLEKFFFCAEVHPSTGEDEEFLAEFQVWFHPSSGGAERLLVSKTAKVFSYLR